MSAKQIFSTSNLCTVEQQLAAWQDVLWQILGRVKVECPLRNSFSAKAEYGRLGQATVCRLQAEPHRIARCTEPGDADRNGMLKLLFVLDGAIHLEHAGQSFAVNAGQWTICDTGRPYTISIIRPVTELIVTMPKDMLGSHQRDMVRRERHAFSAETGPGKVAGQVIGSLFDELESLKSDTAAELMALTLDIARMAMQDDIKCGEAISVREMLHERMSGFIRRNLRDPDLSVDSIASAFACSKRYVHKIFSGENQTAGELILCSRLDRCRRDLADKTLAEQSITGIAFGWGFVNYAHFSRVFRGRYGLSPSAYRAHCIQPALRTAS